MSKPVRKAKVLDLYESRYKLSVGNGVKANLLPDPRLRHSLVLHTALRTPIGPYQSNPSMVRASREAKISCVSWEFIGRSPPAATVEGARRSSCKAESCSTAAEFLLRAPVLEAVKGRRACNT